MVKQQKIGEVGKLVSLINSHEVIGVINMHKLPSRSLQQIRRKLNAKIRMSKRSLIIRAMKSSNKDLSAIEGKINGPVALLFTNENPFRLFKTIKENRSAAAAKAGDVAIDDIVIQKGSTGLPTGPAISALQKVGLKASVQGGKIAILQDKVVVRSGESISADIAGVLSLLKMEPMKIGLDLVAVFDGGIVYDKSVLDISIDEYISEIKKCVHHAINLSVNIRYPTKQNIEIIIQKAFVETKSIAIEANILEKDFIDEILRKAIRQALNIENKINIHE